MAVKEEIEIAQHDINDYEINLYNASLNLDAIEIEHRLPQCYTQGIGIWEEAPALKTIKQKIKNICEIVSDPDQLLKADEIKHAPLLEKWNNTAGDLNKAQTMKTFKHMSSSVKEELQDKTGFTAVEGKQHWQVRPKIGHEVSDNQIGLIETALRDWSSNTDSDIKMLDLLMVKNNRFFSMFDKQTRIAMYSHCKVNRFMQKGYQLEHDVEDTHYLQIILRGNIHIIQVNEELGIQLNLASLRAGEVCGDQSIQRKIRDPLKILSKEHKTAVTNSDETITISIEKEKFMGALFKEMTQELFYKIILLRNTPYFDELSPYSLTIIASNVEVREVKYGEVVV